MFAAERVSSVVGEQLWDRHPIPFPSPSANLQVSHSSVLCGSETLLGELARTGSQTHCSPLTGLAAAWQAGCGSRALLK